MTTRPNLRVLFFDVFGTCLMQRKPVADELWKATKEALESNNSSISTEVRSNATKITYEQWFEFGGKWDEIADEFVADGKKRNSVDWVAVDKYRLTTLHKLLAKLGLIISDESASSSEPSVKEGSLWNDSQIKNLSLVWHRLPPWPDTCRGLELLNQKFATVTLSNTYNGMMQDLVKHSNVPFQHIYTADLFQSFKPNPKVYLGGAEKMGVKPEECALVAAHLDDLKGAKACGFYTIYVVRPLEEKNSELENQNIPDMRIAEDEKGFVTLAKRLGIQVD